MVFGTHKAKYVFQKFKCLKHFQKWFLEHSWTSSFALHLNYSVTPALQSERNACISTNL